MTSAPAPRPTFLVIGAGRSGTTSLHSHLHGHPEVFIPPAKAPSHFYCPDAKRPLQRWYVADRRAYDALFAAAGSARAIGEVSPAYLCSPAVPARIAAALPDVRLVAILRNPVERFHARYVARRRDGLEHAPDEATLLARERSRPLDLDRTADTYLAAGYVSHVLRRYLDVFPRTQLHLCLFDDLKADPAALMHGLCGFIGVDPDIRLDPSVRHNSSGGQIANPVLRAMWTGSAGLRAAVRPWLPRRLRDGAHAIATRRLRPVPMASDVRHALCDLYADEVGELGRLLGRDLGAWLQSPATGRRDPHA